MKTNLEARIEAAAARLKALGNQTLKHPVSSILSLCVLAGAAAMTGAFSQKEGWRPFVIAPILPAEREITDFQNRTQKGTVLAINPDKKSIRFRRESDGKEFDILIEKLSPSDWRWLGMEWKPDGPAFPDPEVIAAAKARPKPETAEELADRLNRACPSAEIYARIAEREERIAEERGYEIITMLQLSQSLKFENMAEKVSLRPEFEALGITIAKQADLNESLLYAGHYLMQYHEKKGQMPLITLEQLRTAMDQAKADKKTNKRPGYGIPGFLDAFVQLNPKNTAAHILEPHTHDANLGTTREKMGPAAYELMIELIKQELREGKPVLIQGTATTNSEGINSKDLEKDLGKDAMLVIGFETDGSPGSTKIEILNSCGPEWGNQGYGWAASISNATVIRPY